MARQFEDDRPDPLRFGEYLREARDRAGFTQRKAAEDAESLARRRGWTKITVSQSLIAQLEAGRVSSPNPRVLRLLTHLYGVDYMSVLMHLIYDRYGILEEEDIGRELALARWDVWQAALRRWPRVAGLSDRDLEIRQLRSKAFVVANEELLDVGAMALWEQRFWKSVPDDQRDLYFVGPSPLADRDPSIWEAVLEMQRLGVTIHYFIPEEEASVHRRVQYLKGDLARQLSREPDALRVEEVRMSESNLILTSTDLVIARPFPPTEAVGFANIRRDGAAIYGVRMSFEDTRRLSQHLDRIRIEDRERRAQELEATEGA